MDLSDIRNEINQIDDQLIRLFMERMDLSRKVAAYKSAHGLPVYVPEREQEIIQKIGLAAGSDFSPYAQKLYTTIFELSREYQQKLLQPQENGLAKYGLLGRNLTHSYSPAIHAQLGNYSYDLYETEPEQLSCFLKEGDFSGLNVTIPYKRSVIPFLQELSPIAKRIGAVNTVIRRADGSLYGHNTDYYGFCAMLRKTGLSVAGKKALILGSGGASATAKTALADMGANPIVISRSGENNYRNLHLHRDAALIVNTTPVGMYPDTANQPLDPGDFPGLEGVLDMIYNPARTKLLMEAEKRGIQTENGLWMLVAQAKEAAEYFTGSVISDETVADIHRRLSAQMRNIILIGMPGSGKTTIGTELANMLGRPFVDTDREVELLAGKSIPEIFSRDGEDAFRKLESHVLSVLGKRSGYVIATGGGCVTRGENYPSLHQNGTIIWIKRPLDALAVNGRPLSQSNDLVELYTQRKTLYSSFSDFSVGNSRSVEEVCTEIRKRLEESV